MKKITRLNIHFPKNKESIDPNYLLFKKNKYFKKSKISYESYKDFCKKEGISHKLKNKNIEQVKKEIFLIKNGVLNKHLISDNKTKKIKRSVNFLKKIFIEDEIKEELVDVRNEILDLEKESKGFVHFLERLKKEIKLRKIIFEKGFLPTESDISVIKFLHKIYINKESWINNLNNKIKDSSYVGLINHFFRIYEDYNSPFLYNLWLQNNNLYKFHLEIMRGSSVFKEFRKNFPKLNWSKKEIIEAISSKNEKTIEELIILKIVKKGGGSFSLYKLFKSYPEVKNYVKNNKEYSMDSRFEEFIIFISKNEDEIDKSQIYPLWDYIVSNNIQKIKGRNIYNLYNQMLEWHKEIYKEKNLKYICWEVMDVIDYFYEEKNKNEEVENTFQIKEIANSIDLFEEGRILKHCIYSYLKNVVNRDSYVFSYSIKSKDSDFKRILTIEIKNNRIVQVRGKNNSLPKENDKKHLVKWAKSNGFSIGGIG